MHFITVHKIIFLHCKEERKSLALTMVKIQKNMSWCVPPGYIVKNKTKQIFVRGKFKENLEIHLPGRINWGSPIISQSTLIKPERLY